MVFGEALPIMMDSNPAVATTENSFICLQYIKRVTLEALHCVRIRCICEPTAPKAFFCIQRGITMEPQGMMMVQLESSLGMESGLVDPSPETHTLEGLYITRILFETAGKYS